MFFSERKKGMFASKRYRINRNSFSHQPSKIKKGLKGLFKFNIFRVINIFLIIGILSSLYFFIFSNYYNITNIEVRGNQIIATDDILDVTNNFLNERQLLLFKNRNIFIFNKKEISEKLNQIALFNDIKIEKILPNTIRINLQEKEAALKWLTNDQEYLVDKQGQIFKRFYKLGQPKIFQLESQPEHADLPQTEDNFIKVKNLAASAANLGDKVLNPDEVQYIFDLNNKLTGLDYLKIKEITVPSNFPQFINFETTDAYKVIFNLSEPAELQIKRLDLIVKEKIQKGNLKRLDYIDLRLGESIYYKFKASNPANPEPNSGQTPAESLP